MHCYSPEETITKLEESSKTILKWFEDNGVKVNLDKCHMLVSKYGRFVANIVEKIIMQKLRNFEDLNRLNFSNHVSNLCKTLRILFNSFFPS